MAKNVVVNGVTYQSVPEVTIPLSEGGMARFVDTTDATAQAQHVLSGYTAYVNSVKVTGNLSTPTVTQDGATKVLTIS